MAFCPNCGRKIEDESVGCPVCNAKHESENNFENPTSFEVKDNQVVADNKPKKSKNGGVGIVIGAIAVVALVGVLAVSLLGGGGYKKAINNYVDFTYKGDVSKLSSLAPSSYWENIEEEHDMKVKDILDEKEEVFESLKEEMEDYYGEKIKVSYKVIEEEKMEKDDLKEVKEHLKDYYDIPKKSVTDAYELEIELSIKGSEDEDEEEIDAVVVKIDGDWYLLSEYYSFVIPGLYF